MSYLHTVSPRLQLWHIKHMVLLVIYQDQIAHYSSGNMHFCSGQTLATHTLFVIQATQDSKESTRQGTTFFPLSIFAPKLKCAPNSDNLFKPPSFKKILFCHGRKIVHICRYSIDNSSFKCFLNQICLSDFQSSTLTTNRYQNNGPQLLTVITPIINN